MLPIFQGAAGAHPVPAGRGASIFRHGTACLAAAGCRDRGARCLRHDRRGCDPDAGREADAPAPRKAGCLRPLPRYHGRRDELQHDSVKCRNCGTGAARMRCWPLRPTIIKGHRQACLRTIPRSQTRLPPSCSIMFRRAPASTSCERCGARRHLLRASEASAASARPRCWAGAVYRCGQQQRPDGRDHGARRQWRLTVVSNVAPEAVVAMADACLAGDSIDGGAASWSCCRCARRCSAS